MTQMDPRRVAAALAMAAALGTANPAAVAAQERDATPRLKVGGLPLAKLLRTEPAAPFIAFESSAVKPVLRAGGKPRGNRRMTTLHGGLIGAGIGAGIGAAYGVSHCRNERGGNCFGWALTSPYGGYGALVGAGIGAAIGALRGS